VHRTCKYDLQTTVVLWGIMPCSFLFFPSLKSLSRKDIDSHVPRPTGHSWQQVPLKRSYLLTKLHGVINLVVTTNIMCLDIIHRPVFIRILALSSGKIYSVGPNR
jgi:hypothetical protein